DRAATAANGSWTVTRVDGKEYKVDASASDTLDELASTMGYTDVEIPEDYEKHFSHLYGLDDQREIAMDAIRTGQDEDWRVRNHTVLVGPPACGKSALCEAIMDALGEDAVVRYDATALTGPGAIKDLTDREILPRIAIFEELEKVVKDEVLDFLLGIMDQRGEIRKTTARANIQREAKMLVFASVNAWAKSK